MWNVHALTQMLNSRTHATSDTSSSGKNYMHKLNKIKCKSIKFEAHFSFTLFLFDTQIKMLKSALDMIRLA